MAKVLGDQHPDVLVCRANLALLRSGARGDGSGQLLGDDPVAIRAIDDLAVQLGQNHPSVVLLQEGQLLYRVTDLNDPF